MISTYIQDVEDSPYPKKKSCQQKWIEQETASNTNDINLRVKGKAIHPQRIREGNDARCRRLGSNHRGLKGRDVA
jgi:hypothetical protein